MIAHKGRKFKLMPRYRCPVEIEVWDVRRRGALRVVQAKNVTLNGFHAFSWEPIDIPERFEYRFETPETPTRKQSRMIGTAAIIGRQQFSVGNEEQFCLVAKIIHVWELTTRLRTSLADKQ
jgi:hypothetical protein